MGKASRAKAERREDRAAVMLRRLRAGLCLHCGKRQRHGKSNWCRPCSNQPRTITQPTREQIVQTLLALDAYFTEVGP